MRVRVIISWGGMDGKADAGTPPAKRRRVVIEAPDEIDETIPREAVLGIWNTVHRAHLGHSQLLDPEPRPVYTFTDVCDGLFHQLLARDHLEFRRVFWLAFGAIVSHQWLVSAEQNAKFTRRMFFAFMRRVPSMFLRAGGHWFDIAERILKRAWDPWLLARASELGYLGPDFDARRVYNTAPVRFFVHSPWHFVKVAMQSGLITVTPKLLAQLFNAANCIRPDEDRKHALMELIHAAPSDGVDVPVDVLLSDNFIHISHGIYPRRESDTTTLATQARDAFDGTLVYEQSEFIVTFLAECECVRQRIERYRAEFCIHLTAVLKLPDIARLAAGFLTPAGFNVNTLPCVSLQSS